MPNDAHSPASDRLPPPEQPLAAYLQDGLRPIEIAVRLGIPIEDVHARIERLHAPGPFAPARARPSADVPVPEPIRPDDASSAPLSRVPLALLGAVALAFIVAVTAFIAAPGRGGDGDSPVRGPVPPEVFGPPPVRINGVPFEPVVLGGPVELDSGVAVLVLTACDVCQSRLGWYVRGPGGLQHIPVGVPLGLGAFTAFASRDGADIVLTAQVEDEWVVFRSRDGGGAWVELWRGPNPAYPVFAGPEHLLLMTGSEPVTAGGPATPVGVLVPGGERFDLTSDPPPQTPWPVDFQIRDEWVPPTNRHPGSVSEDGTRTLEAVEASENRRGNLVALYDEKGKLLKGWSASPAFPWGTLLGKDAYVSGVVNLGGEFVVHDEDEGPYPGDYRVVPTVFDIATGAVHRLDLGLSLETHAVVLTAVRGPFARVSTDDRACSQLLLGPLDLADGVRCAPPGMLLRYLGQTSATSDGTIWYQVLLPSGREGWISAEGVELLGSR